MSRVLAAAPLLKNWVGSVQYRPAFLIPVQSIEEVQAVVRDVLTYPSPVRAKGSHHSTSQCIVAEAGTVLDMTGMSRILRVDAEKLTVTVQAGALLIDIARELEQLNLQLYVNIELGGLTAGSGACCGTKDASCHADGDFEFGQASSYAVGFKLVDGRGDVVEVNQDDDPKQVEALRSSYGLLGVVCEVTYRVKALRALDFVHTEYSLEQLQRELGASFDSRQSTMLYLFPFLNKIVVEHRAYTDGEVRKGVLAWKFRNFLRKHVPALARQLRRLPTRFHGIAIDGYSQLLIKLMTSTLGAKRTSPRDQIIDYPKHAGRGGYEFSIWAFEHAKFAQIIEDYFAFCRDHYEQTGFRCNLPNVSYAVRADQNALFSYSGRGNAFTLDPVCAVDPGSTEYERWTEFLDEYNDFCSEHGGRPLLNQTPRLTPGQFHESYGDALPEFQQIRQQCDPDDRFYSPFFRELFEGHITS